MSPTAVESSVDRYLTLIDVSRVLTSRRSLAELFHELADCLHRLIEFQFLSVVLSDEEHGVMRLHVIETCVGGDMQPGTEFPMQTSPSALVWKTQEPLLIRDLESEERFPLPFLRQNGLRSFCSLPLSTAHRRLGALNFASSRVAACSTDDLEILQLVASQVAVALDNALRHEQALQLQSQLEHDRNRLQLLLDLNNKLVSNLDLRQLFLAVSTSVRRVMDCDYASLSLPEEPGDNPRQMRLYALDFPDSKGYVREGMLYPLEGSSSGEAFRTRQPIVFRYPFSGMEGSPVVQTAFREGLQSVCSLPLISRQGVIGTLNLGRLRPDTFTDDQLLFLRQLATQVAIAVENALDYQQIVESRERLLEQGRYLEEEIRTEHNFEEIVGESLTLRAVLRQVETVAPTNSTVLIHGETGTGKELIARALHDLSARRDHMFVRLNCAAIPLGLLESELFGHEKGAFTGAIAQKIGRFELANRGTLFLDEIGDIPLELQSKLLRVLQEQEFERLGSNRTIRVDARLIAATNRDLSQMVAEKAFRSDLFYRLSVFPISVPPLRERPDDIPLLVRHFTSKFAREMTRRIETIPDEVMEALVGYSWPGNVRELQNFIERAVILSPSHILRPPLAELRRADPAASSPLPSLRDAEREHILNALRASNWMVGGRNGAAARLGLKRTTLVYKMQKLGIVISRQAR